MYFFIIMWLLIIILIALLLKQLKVKHNYIICFFISIVIVLFVLDMNQCINAAISGAELVVKALLPTLLPFSVICNLLIYYDGIDLYSKILGPILCKPLGLSKNASFPIVASFLCGYPLGAKYTCDIYKQGYITRNEFIHLANIATNAGPIFLIGAVGSAMLNSQIYGYILLATNYIAIIIIGLIFRTKKSFQRTKQIINNKNALKKGTLGDALKYSIDNAVLTMLNVSAYVIIFSILISIIKNTDIIIIIVNKLEAILNIPTNSLIGIFLGSIEITNGCKIISSLQLILPIKLGLISFLCSFSGFSIIAQVSSFFAEHNLPMKKYIFKKFLQGVISFLLTFVLSTFFLPSSIATSTTSNTFSYSSLYIYTFITVILLLTPFVFRRFRDSKII